MALRRNPANIQPLVDQMVMVTTEENPKIGDLGLFPAYWDTLGVLVDDSAIGLTRTVEETTVAGAGFGVVSRANKPGDLNMTVETLEDNETTRWIAWPDMVVKNGVEIMRHTGKVAKGNVAIVRVHQNNIVSVEATRHPAQLKMEEVGRGMTVEGKSVAIGLIPGIEKDVLERVWFKIEEDGNAVQLDPKIFVDQDTLTAEKATGYQAGEGAPVKYDPKSEDAAKGEGAQAMRMLPESGEDDTE